MRILSGLFILIAAGAFLASCGSTSQETATLELSTKVDNDMGMFFAGPNTFQAQYNVDLATLIEGKEVAADDIKSISVSSATINVSKNDSLSLADFNSASLQLASNNEDIEMTSFAVINPIESEGDEIALNVSSEADVAAFFKEDVMTFVLDLDLKNENYFESMMCDIKLELNLEIKN
ncbi:MAG: hypothetical protein JXQ87_03685 [Bacteroidia bacterium]